MYELNVIGYHKKAPQNIHNIRTITIIFTRNEPLNVQRNAEVAELKENIKNGIMGTPNPKKEKYRVFFISIAFST